MPQRSETRQSSGHGLRVEPYPTALKVSTRTQNLTHPALEPTHKQRCGGCQRRGAPQQRQGTKSSAAAAGRLEEAHTAAHCCARNQCNSWT